MLGLKSFRYAPDILGFKVSNQIANLRYFRLVGKKNCFARENAKEAVEDLGTG